MTARDRRSLVEGWALAVLRAAAHASCLAALVTWIPALVHPLALDGHHLRRLESLCAVILLVGYAGPFLFAFRATRPGTAWLVAWALGHFPRLIADLPVVPDLAAW